MKIKEKMMNSSDSFLVDFQVMVAPSDSQLYSCWPSSIVLFPYSTMNITIKMQSLKVEIGRKGHLGTKKSARMPWYKVVSLGSFLS